MIMHLLCACNIMNIIIITGGGGGSSSNSSDGQ